MRLDGAYLFALLAVFVRVSAMLFVAPVFGAPSIPARIRILFGAVMALALCPVVRAYLPEPPPDLYGVLLLVANEALAGFVVGVFLTLVMLGIMMGGSIMDIQVGLSMSHVVNPASGQASTLLSQFKYMLALVVLVCANGHHILIKALVGSFRVLPVSGMGVLEAIRDQHVYLLAQMSLIALQIAAPILAVTVLVDAALGLMNRAVPQMQTFIVGLPAKVLMGLVALSVGLPAITAAVANGVELATRSMQQVMAVKR